MESPMIVLNDYFKKQFVFMDVIPEVTAFDERLFLDAFGYTNRHAADWRRYLNYTDLPQKVFYGPDTFIGLHQELKIPSRYALCTHDPVRRIAEGLQITTEQIKEVFASPTESFLAEVQAAIKGVDGELVRLFLPPDTTLTGPAALNEAMERMRSDFTCVGSEVHPELSSFLFQYQLGIDFPFFYLKTPSSTASDPYFELRKVIRSLEFYDQQMADSVIDHMLRIIEDNSLTEKFTLFSELTNQRQTLSIDWTPYREELFGQLVDQRVESVALLGERPQIDRLKSHLLDSFSVRVAYEEDFERLSCIMELGEEYPYPTKFRDLSEMKRCDRIIVISENAHRIGLALKQSDITDGQIVYGLMTN